MKVVSRMKEFIAIKVNFSADFFVTIGKYLDDKYYTIKQGDISRGCNSELFLKIDDQEIKVKYGYYILIDPITKDVKYLHEEIFNNDYLELKEEVK